MGIIKKFFFRTRYFSKPPWDTGRTPPEVMDFIAENTPGRALDLGCGTGTNVITLAKNGWQAIGVDFIPKAIRSARRKAGISVCTAQFQVGDVAKSLDFEKPFDFILDIGCYHSLRPKDKAAYRENLKRLLISGGTFMIYFRSRTNDDYSGAGATEADLYPFLDFMELVSKSDGINRGSIKSMWLTYQKPKGL